MKICAVEAELFHADKWMDWWTDGHDNANKSLVAILQIHLKNKFYS